MPNKLPNNFLTKNGAMPNKVDFSLVERSGISAGVTIGEGENARDGLF